MGPLMGFSPRRHASSRGATPAVTGCAVCALAMLPGGAALHWLLLSRVLVLLLVEVAKELPPAQHERPLTFLESLLLSPEMWLSPPAAPVAAPAALVAAAAMASATEHPAMVSSALKAVM